MSYLNKDSIMISICDISVEIKFEEEKSHTNLLQIINATVSHELRNPLNSIIAVNLQKEFLYNQLKKILNNENMNKNLMYDKVKEILPKLMSSLKT